MNTVLHSEMTIIGSDLLDDTLWNVGWMLNFILRTYIWLGTVSNLKYNQKLFKICKTNQSANMIFIQMESKVIVNPI